MVKPTKKRSLTRSALRLSAGFEFVERIVQCEQIDVRLGNRRLDVAEPDPFPVAASFRGVRYVAPGRRVSAASLQPPRRRSGHGCSTPAP